MPSKNEHQNENETQSAKQQANEQTTENKAAGETLDFEAMDLSVESVEERISPSETNVFDK